MIEIVRATEEHGRIVAANIRKADADELLALGFASPMHGVTESLRVSLHALCGLHDGVPLAVFGYAGDLIGMGCVPWLISTREVDRHPVAFARASRRIVGLMGELGHLENLVDARHTVCVRWLKWLGFTVHEAVALPNGYLFHRFEMKGA